MKFERKTEHKRDERLEKLLREVNGLLGPQETQALSSFEKPEKPVVLIMGSPRSGTTLMLQWLASTGCFAYPTNLLSRFYGAPYIGAMIQLMLTKYDFNKEIFDFNPEVPFTSNLGKTHGALAPNEFWYFWRRFFKFGEIQKLHEDDLKKVDHKKFVSELAALETVFEKPFAMKGMIVNWNIPFISSILDRVLFLYIRRHPFYNIQSLLGARLNYYGDKGAWYSFKPPEYPDLKDRGPYEQVSGQIYHTNRAVEEGLAKVDDSKVLTVDYEAFCRSPESTFNRIAEKFSQQGCKVDWKYNGPESFDVTNRVTLSEHETQKVIKAYERITGETTAP